MQRLITYTVLIICIAVLLFPLYVMVVGSFTDIQGFLKRPPALLLNNPTLINYKIIIVGAPIAIWTLNTIIVTGTTVVLSCLTVVLAGYCFARYPGRIVNAVYMAFLLSLMVPKNVLIIPLIMICRRLGISGTIAAAILPGVFYPVGIFIYKRCIESIPTDYEDSARMDGAGEWMIITKVLFPMSKSAIAAIATFVALGAMQDYLWQFIVLQRVNRRTLLVGLIDRAYQTGNNSDLFINPIGTKMAAGVLIFVPLLMVYIFAHKKILEGIATGGIK